MFMVRLLVRAHVTLTGVASLAGEITTASSQQNVHVLWNTTTSDTQHPKKQGKRQSSKIKVLA
jgi:hypothetical protein